MKYIVLAVLKLFLRNSGKGGKKNSEEKRVSNFDASGAWRMPSEVVQELNQFV